MKQVLFIVLLVVAGCLGIWKALDIGEETECMKWKEEASKYPGYYYVDWQIQQCNHQGIILK